MKSPGRARSILLRKIAETRGTVKPPPKVAPPAHGVLLGAWKLRNGLTADITHHVPRVSHWIGTVTVNLYGQRVFMEWDENGRALNQHPSGDFDLAARLESKGER